MSTLEATYREEIRALESEIAELTEENRQLNEALLEVQERENELDHFALWARDLVKSVAYDIQGRYDDL